MMTHGIKPEVEVFDLAMLYNARDLLDRGLLKAPVHCQFVLGLRNALPPRRSVLEFLVSELKDVLPGATWTAAGIGRYQARGRRRGRWSSAATCAPAWRTTSSSTAARSRRATPPWSARSRSSARSTTRGPATPAEARAAAVRWPDAVDRTAVAMEYKLTYSTMFDPPPALHERFEAALARVRAGLGATHAQLHRRAQTTPREITPGEIQPDPPRPAARPLPRRHGRRGRRRRWRPRTAPGPPGAACRAAERIRILRRVAGAHRGARLRHRRRGRAGGRQEPHGGARRGPGDGRLLHRVLRRLRAAGTSITRCPTIRSRATAATTAR